MRFGPVRRGALCAVASLSMVAGTAAAAPSDTTTPGDTTSFTAAGPKVELQTARGSAPDLRPGVYRSSAPADKTTRYAKVTRSKGETLTVNVSGTPTAAEDGRMTDDDKISLELVDSDGDRCTGDDSYRSEGDPVGPLIITLVLDAKENERSSYLPDSCRDATSFHLEVTRETDDESAPAMPLELQVTREPKVSGPLPAADPVEPVKAPSLSATTTTTGGHGFSDATTVRAGSERTDLRLGSTTFFKVRVGWSQRLGVSLEVPRNGSSFAPPYDADVSVHLWSPQRLDVGSTYADGLSNSTVVSKDDGSPSTIGSYTAAVRYANRTAEDPDLGDLPSEAYEGTTVAGWYYIEVRTVASGDDDPTTSDRAIPARLNVKVTGTATEGPHYVAADGARMTAPPPGQLSVGGEQDSLPWGRIAGGAAAVLLAVIACLWALRSRRRSA